MQCLPVLVLLDLPTDQCYHAASDPPPGVPFSIEPNAARMPSENCLTNSIAVGIPTTSRPCYIHVGTHKTGTTSLQAFLRDNEERFMTHGVVIPRAGRGDDAAGHHNLTQQLLEGRDFIAERGGLNEIFDELRRSDKPRACISSEDFSLVSRSRESLVTVRDAISAAGFTPVIVVYLRPQVSYCVSIYAEIVKNGNQKAFATYLAEIEQHGSFLWNGSLGPLCRYDVLLDRFAAVFGEESIIVRRYRSGARKNALLRSFARLLIGATVDLDPFVFPPERFNRSLSFRGVLRALESNVEMTDMRFAPLDLRKTLELAASFYSVNRTIAQRYGTWVPPCELSDVLLALPLRKTPARTIGLLEARHALRQFDPEKPAVSAQSRAHLDSR